MNRILVVEDNESYLSILNEKLKHEEFVVFTANNGIDGLEEAEKNSPDIILIDLLLPKMNGIQVMQELRQTMWGKNIPLIVLTNLNNDDVEIIIVANGADPKIQDYVSNLAIVHDINFKYGQRYKLPLFFGLIG